MVSGLEMRPGCECCDADLPADAIYTVTEVYPDHAVLDGNHPLAGIALRLALVVRDVREASEDEIEAGLGERKRDPLADAAPAAGDHGDGSWVRHC